MYQTKPRCVKLITPNLTVQNGDQAVTHFLPISKLNEKNTLELLWLELTRTCNEQCSFCYNASGPNVPLSLTLPEEKWLQTLHEANDLGVTNLSIIGGEPLVLPWFERFLQAAVGLSFQNIELATNGTLVTESIARCMGEARVSAAISIYSATPEIHDKETKLRGSFLKTMAGIKLLREYGVRIRINHIITSDDRDEELQIRELVSKFGITDVGSDRVRKIGRAENSSNESSDQKTAELCGACAGKYACVSADGDIFPCIMSRHMKSGSLKHQTLKEAIEGSHLASNRTKIGEVTRINETSCNPNQCDPTFCGPTTCRPVDSCGPDKCRPQWG